MMMCHVTDNNKIVNYNIPSCNHCIYFMPERFEYNSKCKLFGEKNIITNELNYDNAKTCRNDENKCGITGKYHKELEDYNKVLRDIIYI